MRRPVDGVEVDRDPKSHANLVSPGIAPADGPGGIVHLVRDAVPGECFSCKKRRRGDDQDSLHTQQATRS